MRTNEAAIFATPSRVLSNGIALGHASQGHCARAIAESAAAVANYRKAPTSEYAPHSEFVAVAVRMFVEGLYI